MTQICDYGLSRSDAEIYLTDNEKRTLNEIHKRVHQRKLAEKLKDCYSQLEDIRLDLQSFMKGY